MSLIVMYMDIYPGLTPETSYFIATNKPASKSDAAKRIRFVVDVPDHLFYTFDEEIIIPIKTEEEIDSNGKG